MDGVLAALARYGYAVVFGTVFAEQIGLPFPSEPFLIATGGLVGARRLDPALVVTFAGLASLLGDTVWYWIGRRGGPRVLGWLCRLSLEPDSCVRRGGSVFDAYGAKALVVAKFVPGLSTIAPPLAGVGRMQPAAFTLWSAVAGVLWVGAYVGLGWIFSAQLELAAAYAARLGSWAVVLLIAAAAVWIGWKALSRQRFLRKLRIARITPEDLKAQLDRGDEVVIVDLRPRRDFETDPAVIPGALHLTTEELEARHAEIPRDRDIVLYCT